MKRKTALLLCALILLLGTALRLYLGSQKAYLHIDEAYSYGLMNDSVLNITDRPDFYGPHPDSHYYLSYLSIEREEWKDWSPVWENQARDNDPPLYYLLLRAAASLAGGAYTKWSGLLLNLLIASCSGLPLYRLGVAFSGSRPAGCLACLLGTFSFLSLDMSLFIRMYELANLAVLLLFCAHLPWLLPHPAGFGAGTGATREGAAGEGSATYRSAAPPTGLQRLACAAAFFLAAVLFLCLFPAAWGHVFGGYRGLGGGDGSAASLPLLWDRIRLWDQTALQNTGLLLGST